MSFQAWKCISLFFLLLLIEFSDCADVDFCSKKYKCKNESNFICELGHNCDVSKHCKGYEYHSITPYNKKLLVELHNFYRNKIAIKRVLPNIDNIKLPTAADMKEMFWDNELEFLAQCWANQCPGAPHETLCFKNTGMCILQSNAIHLVGANAFCENVQFSSLIIFIRKENYLRKQILKTFNRNSLPVSKGCDVSTYSRNFVRSILANAFEYEIKQSINYKCTGISFILCLYKNVSQAGALLGQILKHSTGKEFSYNITMQDIYLDIKYVAPSDIASYNWIQNNYTMFMIHNFLQLVYSNATQFGCARSSFYYNAYDEKAHLIVCLYNRAILPNKRTYVFGKPCSLCSSCNNQYKGLCKTKQFNSYYPNICQYSNSTNCTFPKKISNETFSQKESSAPKLCKYAIKLIFFIWITIGMIKDLYNFTMMTV